MVIVKKTGQSKSFDKLKAHLKYICFRSKEIQKPIIFDRTNDHADHNDFIKRQEEKPGLSHGLTIKGHHLMFSLSENQYSALDRDYKEVIRESIREYEQSHHIKLDYIASIHLKDGKGKTSHPHVHLVVSGIGTSDEGQSKRVYFRKDDFKDLREKFENTYLKSIDPEKNVHNRLLESNKELSLEISKALAEKSNNQGRHKEQSKDKEKDKTKDRDKTKEGDKIENKDRVRERER